MKIETKFNIGDPCFFVQDNYIQRGTIEAVEIKCQFNRTFASFCVYYYDYKTDELLSEIIYQDWVFHTLEDMMGWFKIKFRELDELN